MTPSRILIAVTHLLGSGHLVRAGHLAQALAGAGHDVTLVSGGMPLGREFGSVRFVQLPPVRTFGTDFRNLLDEDGAPVSAQRLDERRLRLETLARELSPGVVIAEHFPFGRRQLAPEFLTLIAAAREANPGVLVLASVRDVLVTPKPARIAEAHERIAALFDAVLVHGDERLLPLDASWPVSPELRAKLHYTGYLAGPTDDAARSDASEEILVSGGGSAAALPLYWLCLEASRLLGPPRRWRLLLARSAGAAALTGLRGEAPAHVTVEWARPDFPALLAGCALSISQAGYNTALDLLAARCPAILVPFEEGGETEQAIRAAALERAGLARVLPLSELSAESLAQACRDALGGPAPPSVAIARDGAAGSVAALRRLLAERT